jgi:hypothetical protein
MDDITSQLLNYINIFILYFIIFILLILESADISVTA